MKTMNILGDIEVKIRNKREESLVKIFNDQIKDYLSYMIEEEENIVGNKLLLDGELNHNIKEMFGQASAMYFLGMVAEPVTSNQIWSYLARGYMRAGNGRHTPESNFWLRMVADRDRERETA